MLALTCMLSMSNLYRRRRPPTTVRCLQTLSRESPGSVSAADVRCWAYNPPGGLVSANLSAAMKPFCTSVIVSKDAISRMSLKNISGMIDEMLIALARCKQPTLKVHFHALYCDTGSLRDVLACLLLSSRTDRHVTDCPRYSTAPRNMPGTPVCIFCNLHERRHLNLPKYTRCLFRIRWRVVGAPGAVQHGRQDEAARADRPAPVLARGDPAGMPRAPPRVCTSRRLMLTVVMLLSEHRQPRCSTAQPSWPCHPRQQFLHRFW